MAKKLLTAVPLVVLHGTRLMRGRDDAAVAAGGDTRDEIKDRSMMRSRYRCTFFFSEFFFCQLRSSIPLPKTFFFFHGEIKHATRWTNAVYIAYQVLMGT